MAMPARGKDTPKKQRGSGDWRPAFLATLANTGNVRASAQAAGIERRKAYAYAETHPRFAAEWQEALTQAIDVLEAAARQRALRISDTLLIFLLKSHRPEVYRETLRQEHSGVGGGPIPFQGQAFISFDAQTLAEAFQALAAAGVLSGQGASVAVLGPTEAPENAAK